MSRLNYTFEKVYGENKYQARLCGEFVGYVKEKDSKLADDILRFNGYDSREEFLELIAYKY